MSHLLLKGKNKVVSVYRHRIVVNAVAYVLLLLIAFIDFSTGYEISSSLLYLLPIYMVSAHGATNKKDSLFVAGLSSVVWFIVESQTGFPYTHAATLYWNSAVRMLTFFILALAIYKIKSKKRQLELANKRLEEVSQEKNKYIGIAAHDIRNPLSNIFLLSKLLADPRGGTTLNQQQQEYIRLIGSISAGALSLLNNILDISQIEAGTLKVQKEEQEYLALVNEVVQMNKPIAGEKGQVIEVVSAKPALWLPFDKTYISQVLMNLLTNAIKFSFKDAVIRVIIKEEEGFVVTRVEDQGVGIREEDKEKIFRPFEKAQNQPTAGERSSGLGLAIVKKVVEAHGGNIGVESTYGKGATFYFSLPLAPAAVAPA
ncbi:sensor histidine kinase KdpD [Cesiribacter sp. SM1]|uniref:sensor histidine kinase n=1 Tax=Cesiribacter sp. SM1 TaxID=2861196 RepID=UPI001CD6D1F3|nr:HAMP domain-containing sensor histidine kinase [Cesiribacter sp. SM1]